MVNDFAKFDGAERVDLDDALAEAVKTLEEGSEDFFKELMEMVAQVAEAASVKELDGYRIYRLVVGDRAYYPRKDTFRVLPTGWAIFIDDLQSDEELAIYTTIKADKVEAINWLPDPDAQEQKDAKAA